MRRLLIAALLLCAPAGPLLALPEDAAQPIHIRADNAEIDNKANRVIYRGSVQVDQGTLRVTADEMTVEIENEQVIRIVATGEPARYKQQLNADEEIVNANASTIIYHTQEERVDLQGQAYLEQAGNTITGDVIRYDIVAGKIDAEAGTDSKVQMELPPAQRR